MAILIVSPAASRLLTMSESLRTNKIVRHRSWSYSMIYPQEISDEKNLMWITLVS